MESEHDQMIASQLDNEVKRLGLEMIAKLKDDIKASKAKETPKSREPLKVFCQDFRYSRTYQTQARRALASSLNQKRK